MPLATIRTITLGTNITEVSNLRSAPITTELVDDYLLSEGSLIGDIIQI
jgi:hypothetical protein